ncbi:hypothetical protein BVX97_04200 [bacterium E08(2017)]|nr:hypothetical protein BVX97_04200 [bacterium E08(2017)]
MRKKSIIALCLLVPAPTLGVIAAMYVWAGAGFGQILFACSKLWILALPLVWTKLVDREGWSFSIPRRGGMVIGLISGFVISAAILAVYWLLAGRMIDAATVQDMAEKVGLSDKKVYIMGAIYWVLVNAVLEEYVWRWFVVKKLQAVAPGIIAVLLSALAFTIHHVIALNVYFAPGVNLICSSGIFVGGAIWSWFYTRYHSIWPGYLSHAVVDVAVFWIGYDLIFG